MKKFFKTILLLTITSYAFSQKTITVHGSATQEFDPDVIYCSLNISSSNYQMKPKEFNSKVSNILDFIRVRTELVNPEKADEDCSAGLYKNLNLKVKDKSRIDQIRDQLKQMNLANQGIYTEIYEGQAVVSEENLAAKDTEMFQTAVEDAKKRATRLANSMGYKIGEIHSVEDSNMHQNYSATEVYESPYGNATNTDYVKSVKVTFEMNK